MIIVESGPDFENRPFPEPGHTSSNPLAGSRLQVRIGYLLAEYELRHRFRNTGNEAMEAIYTFPMPLDATFLGMDARIGNEWRCSQIQPAAAARATFDDAIAEGDSAVLLEQLEPGLLCVDLGNLLPGEDGEVVLRFAAALQVAGGIARFSLPLVQRPRYGRSQLDIAAQVRHDFATEHLLDVQILVAGALTRGRVHCASHGIGFQRDDNVLNLDIPHAQMDRDLVLTFELPPERKPEGWLVRDDTGCVISDEEPAIAVARWVLPQSTGAGDPVDLCLVLDGSGSMQGDAIAQSRSALQAVARLLRDEDRVQVLRFGSSVVPLFRRPLRATERVRQALRELTGTVRANLGGTEMSAALDAALRALPAPGTGSPEGRKQAIVLVTDGAVQPEDLVELRERAARAGVRIFVVAVSSSAGVAALQPLARDTQGVLERSVPAEPIDAAVQRHLARCRHDPVDIHVGCNRAAHILTMPPAYPGDAITAIALLNNGLGCTLTLWMGQDGERHSLALEPAWNDEALYAWAGQQVYLQAPADQREALALRHGLITTETSAVLVRERDTHEKPNGLPRVVPVAHMTPAGMVLGEPPAFLRKQMHAPRPKFSRSARTPNVLHESIDTADMNQLSCGMVATSPEHEDLHQIPSAEPLPPQRLRALQRALREALDTLLATTGTQPISMQALLQQLDASLRTDAEHYLHDQGFHLVGTGEVWRLLAHLANPGIGNALSDEQEALLAVHGGLDT